MSLEPNHIPHLGNIFEINMGSERKVRHADPIRLQIMRAVLLKSRRAATVLWWGDDIGTG